MNFYLDFEATQFSNRIISIGCVSETGESFKTLVKPVNGGKVNQFITDLTGITNEMLDNAPSADDAFNQFFNFVINVSDNTAPKYFCYGDSDKDFIKHTVKYMTDVRAISFAVSVETMLINYAKNVRAYFSSNDISLKKLVALVRHVDEVEQKHDVMDDAMMLKECFDGLNTLDKSVVPEASRKVVKGDLKPMKLSGVCFTKEQMDYLKNLRTVQWGCGVKADKINGDTTEENWEVKLTHIYTGAVKYFSAPWVAAMFLNGYVRTGRSSKKQSDINKTMKEMASNPNNYSGYRCEIAIKEG